MSGTSGFNVGDLVEYRSAGGDVIERGFVTRRNDRVVFVRFGLDIHAKACAASDLRLILVTAPDPYAETCTPMGVNARGVAQCAEGHGDYPDACDEATS